MLVPGRFTPPDELASGLLLVGLILLGGCLVVGFILWLVLRRPAADRPRPRPGDRAVKLGIAIAVLVLLAALTLILRHAMLPG